MASFLRLFCNSHMPGIRCRVEVVKELQTEFSFWYAKLSIPEEQFVFDFVGSLEVSHLGMKCFVDVVVFLDFLDQFRGILDVGTWFMVVLDTTWVKRD